VIELVNDRFVNVWTVIEELERLKGDAAGDPELREFATTLLADYKYPVDSQLRAPDGALVRQVAANDLMAAGAGMDRAYLEFLEKPLE
jgi:hypothetical protein